MGKLHAHTLFVPRLAQPQPADVSSHGSPWLCAQSFYMYCSSSLSFRSRDHLSPPSSMVALCRESLSDVREDRDTWLT